MAPLGDFTELRGLLDALCDETIRPEQMRRLEELLAMARSKKLLRRPQTI